LPDPSLRFHGVVGAVAAFSTFLEKIFSNQEIRPSLSIFLTQNRHTSGGWEMTTDDIVVDVSRDWVLACDVQRRFMQGLGRTSDSVDYSVRCRQVRALGGDCYDFMPLSNDAWRWSLAMPPAKASPRHS